eukprot:1917090-Rhodomonas_salina.1
MHLSPTPFYTTPRPTALWSGDSGLRSDTGLSPEPFRYVPASLAGSQSRHWHSNWPSSDHRDLVAFCCTRCAHCPVIAEAQPSHTLVRPYLDAVRVPRAQGTPCQALVRVVASRSVSRVPRFALTRETPDRVGAVGFCVADVTIEHAFVHTRRPHETDASDYVQTLRSPADPKLRAVPSRYTNRIWSTPDPTIMLTSATSGLEYPGEQAERRLLLSLARAELVPGAHCRTPRRQQPRTHPCSSPPGTVAL